MTQSSRKGDMKSKSHPSVKLAPVQVFSCKHPLTCSAEKWEKKTKTCLPLKHLGVLKNLIKNDSVLLLKLEFGDVF